MAQYFFKRPTQFAPAHKFSQSDIQAVDSGGAAGSMVIGDSTLSGSTGILATIPLAYPSFSFSGHVATALGTPLVGNVTASASPGNPASKAELRDSNGVTRVTGLTVDQGGPADVILSTTNLQSGEIVTFSDGSLLLA
jgi:hypothetical protein